VASNPEPIALAGGLNTTQSSSAASHPKNDFAILLAIAAGTLLVHLLTACRYGFNRDELAILEDARHLA